MGHVPLETYATMASDRQEKSLVDIQQQLRLVQTPTPDGGVLVASAMWSFLLVHTNITDSGCRVRLSFAKITIS